MTAGLPAGYRLPDDLAASVGSALERAAAERWVERCWQKDASLWSGDPDVQARISARLGWLRVPEEFLDHPEELAAFASGLRAEGFEAAVLLGMGGSSLAPQVLLDAFGTAEGGMEFFVLDSTDPVAVARVRDACDPARTLYIVSTKSGSTTETLSFHAFFWDVVHHRGGGPVEEHFAAITDAGKSLEAIPHSDDFRSLFLNPPDVGGRFSALTYVGLVPAALLELDLAEILARGVGMAQRCREEGLDNPGLVLGLTLGTLARAGRDKLTIWADPSIETLGAWIEQLIAESTGKEGTGIVPVDREPFGAADRYGNDRVFVRFLVESDAATGGDGATGEEGAADAAAWRAESDRLAGELEGLGHPVIDLDVPVLEAIGAEFFRWEFATAIAGAVLGVNPFDEPNVAESKRNTEDALDEHRRRHALPARRVLAAAGPLAVVGDRQAAGASAYTSDSGSDRTIAGELRRHLDRIPPTGYTALQAYVASTPERDDALADIRALLRDRTGRPATAGYGPRFLHSTGQLHKGGTPSGWFLQLVAGHPRDLEIHGAGYTFATLVEAQAEGDLASLEAHGLPVLRVHLSDDPDRGLVALRAALADALDMASKATRGNAAVDGSAVGGTG
jgi:transaldolase / glucose-6-phosphate isomerase